MTGFDPTPDTLRSALSVWWTTRLFPAAWLDALTPETAGRPGPYRSMILLERLHDAAWGHLAACRARVGLTVNQPPPTLDAMRDAIRRDFSAPQIAPMDDLMLWSAAYHRHLAAVRVRTAALAGWAGMSERNFRRHTLAGLRLLVVALAADYPADYPADHPA